MHAERDIKLEGHAAEYFYVCRHPEYPNNNFMVMRSDGKAVHFSYRYALNPLPRRDWFSIAARTAVTPDITEYRKAYFATHADAEGKAPCEITGKRITLTESDVHHAGAMQLRAIVQAFLQGRGLDPEKIEYVGTTDGAAVLTFADATLAADFVSFHTAKAKLQVVSKTVHRSLPKGNR